jgi:hypothetical protein
LTTLFRSPSDLKEIEKDDFEISIFKSSVDTWTLFPDLEKRNNIKSASSV